MPFRLYECVVWCICFALFTLLRLSMLLLVHITCSAGDLVHAVIRLCDRLGATPTADDIEGFLAGCGV